MAKQEGIFLFEGTSGGVSYYFREGEALARLAGGGFTRKAIKKGENMVKVRESNSEFAACSQVNKIFKAAVKPFLQGYKDGTLHSRLMQLFLKIKDSDSMSPRGQRTVQHGMEGLDGKLLLKDFIFTPLRTPVLPCDYGFDWTNLSLRVKRFSWNEAGFPQEADDMEILFGVIRVDFASLTYQRVLADPLIIGRDFDENSFEIQCGEMPSGEGVLFSMVRVNFYRTIDGKRCLLEGDNGVSIKVLSVC